MTVADFLNGDHVQFRFGSHVFDVRCSSFSVFLVSAPPREIAIAQGFFGPRTPCDNLEAAVVALPYFASLGLSGESTVVVSPDAGGVARAKKVRVNAPWLVIFWRP